MIPKSLLIAIIIGTVAAVALGIYLEKIRSHDLEFVEGASISILVEKQDYELGESVAINIINSGTTEITFLDQPSLQVRALDGTVFFSTSFNGLKLSPNQKHVYEWLQQKNDNSKIIEGRYVIDAFAYVDNQKISDSTTVNILR